jgi:ABC-2 type transport system ATP-binding protein
MWETIRELVDEGCTVLLTTQYLDEADQLADRIAVIDRGVKVAEGTSDELKSSVGRSSLTVHLADRDDLVVATTTARALVGEDPVPSPESRRLSVPLERSEQAVDVLVALREKGIGIESLTVQKPSLDEVFLALTGHAADSDTADSDTADTDDSDTDDSTTLEAAS